MLRITSLFLIVASVANAQIPKPGGGSGGGGGGTGPTGPSGPAGVLPYCAPVTASGSAYTCTATSFIGYVVGSSISFFPDVSNSAGAVTINVSGLGVKSIKLADGTTNLAAADMVGTNSYILTYDGTVFRLTPLVPLGSGVSGILAATKGGTGLSSFTSGGIPFFSSSTAISSSGALTANLPVIGGGAGVAPSVGTRSGNTTAFVTTTGTQTSGDCVKIDANGNHIANGSGCGGLSGLTNTALLAASSTSTANTPSATTTLDSGGNVSTPGSGAFGVGGSVGGGVTYGQGTAISIVANSIVEYAPASVTGYRVVKPGAAATGIIHRTNSSNDVTESVSAVNLASADVTGILAAANGGSVNLFSSITSAAATATSPTSIIGTVVGTTTAPANSFTAGGTLVLTAEGFMSAPATPASITMDILIGGTVRLTSGSIPFATATGNIPWQFSCTITTRTTGASGTQIGSCVFLTPIQLFSFGPATTTWTMDTTATKVIDVQATWSTTTNAPSITGTNVVGKLTF